jgi:hypothetical protein
MCCKLTAIIPFLNEGNEVLNTVQSIWDTSKNIDIILTYRSQDIQVIFVIEM